MHNFPSLHNHVGHAKTFQSGIKDGRKGVIAFLAGHWISTASPGTSLLWWLVKRSIVMIMPKLQQMASILQSLQRWRKQLARECAAPLPVHKGIHYNIGLKVKLFFNRLWYHTYQQRRVIYSVQITYTKWSYNRLHTKWIYKRCDISLSLPSSSMGTSCPILQWNVVLGVPIYHWLLRSKRAVCTFLPTQDCISHVCPWC